jgi:YHS domain-containing protein
MKINLLISFFLLITVVAFSQVDPIDKTGVFLDGYDVVAYFSGKAEKGNKQINSNYNGATYYFLSKENQKIFEADPVKYLPQYDGYCALGVSYGKKISVDPNTFRITNGKLYLFYNGDAAGKKVNSLDTWNKNENRLLKKADELWPDVKKRRYRKDDAL